MADRACVLFKETRISIGPTTASPTPTANTYNVRLASHRSTITSTTRRRSIQQHSSGSSGSDKNRDVESIFRYQYLASAASIFFRRVDLNPRSILYRVLENGEVLSIQATDIARGPGEGKGATPILRFHFAPRYPNSFD